MRCPVRGVRRTRRRSPSHRTLLTREDGASVNDPRQAALESASSSRRRASAARARSSIARPPAGSGPAGGRSPSGSAARVAVEPEAQSITSRSGSELVHRPADRLVMEAEHDLFAHIHVRRRVQVAERRVEVLAHRQVQARDDARALASAIASASDIGHAAASSSIARPRDSSSAVSAAIDPGEPALALGDVVGRLIVRSWLEALRPTDWRSTGVGVGREKRKSRASRTPLRGPDQLDRPSWMRSSSDSPRSGRRAIDFDEAAGCAAGASRELPRSMRFGELQLLPAGVEQHCRSASARNCSSPSTGSAAGPGRASRRTALAVVVPESSSITKPRSASWSRSAPSATQASSASRSASCSMSDSRSPPRARRARQGRRSRPRREWARSARACFQDRSAARLVPSAGQPASRR